MIEFFYLLLCIYTAVMLVAGTLHVFRSIRKVNAMLNVNWHMGRALTPTKKLRLYLFAIFH